MKFWLIFSYAAVLCLVASGQTLACEMRVEHLTLDLAGTTSRAEIIRPVGPVIAAAVLVHGSDVADLDNAIVSNGHIVSRPLGDIAHALACSGVATLRYDKRHVRGAEDVDREAFSKLTLQDLASDAERALDRITATPDLASRPRFLLGWSEGTAVAADVAARRRDLAGLVLLAPVLNGFASTLQAQWPRVGMTYVERYARDGMVDADGLKAAGDGPGGLIAKMYVGFLKGFTPGSQLNAVIDKDHDERINLRTEATPTFQGWFADTPGGGLGIYATDRALPKVVAQLEKIKIPVLILQGENDGNIDPSAASALDREHRPQLTIRFYPGLGHALGPAASAQEDTFQPPAAEPLQAIGDWMHLTAGRAR
jgi:pimeloyl-ACP methyl ester carboxylesterase